MNKVVNSTSDAEAPEHPWVKARRLAKELAATLAECDEGNWFAHVTPPNSRFSLGFGALPMGEADNLLPVDRVNGLCWQLSEALTEYLDGRFQAMVIPSAIGGHTVMLSSIKAFDRRAAS